jgi:Uma2 family endonuclease
MSTALEFDLDAARHPIKKGEPAWDVALLFPSQGEWSEAAYLAINTNRLIELADGCLEVLPMPALPHQLMVAFLYAALRAHVHEVQAGGYVVFAPLRVRLWPGQIREPDVVWTKPARVREMDEPPDGADLVMEVVSGSSEDRRRDLEIKRHEYARAGIPEYWIVDPQEKRITVLALDADQYRVHGEFGTGARATSVLLPGFGVEVSAGLAAGEAPGT